MRSDIFSLGIVFYEMLTGRLPFKGKASIDVMHSVMHDEPSPIEGVPPQLQQIVAKMLVKDANARYQSAERLLADLRALVRSYYADQGVPRDKAALRQAVERVIGTLKCRYGLARCRYLGLRRNHNHLWLKGICYNLRKMLALQGAT